MASRAHNIRDLPDAKILVVEDDPRMCESVRSLLSLHGYDIQTSLSVLDALKSLSVRAFNIVILDLLLEDQSGFVVMDYLMVRKLDTRVIVMTGHQSENNAITAIQKGAADYLKKPVEPEVLLESIEKALNQRRERHGRDPLYERIISSRSRFRQVVDSQKDFILRLSTDFSVTFANKAFADAFDSTPRAMIGRAYQTLIGKSIQASLLERLRSVRPGAKAITVEYQITDVHGYSRYQRWQFQGVTNEIDLVQEIQCIGRDVTQEKIQQKKIEKKTVRFRQLAEITSDWIWEVDLHGAYTYSSPVVYEILGYRPGEVVGKKAFDFMPAEEARRLEKMFQRVSVGGKPFKTIENTSFHKSGIRVTLETSGVPIFGRAGALIGYRGVSRNVTQRKLAEKRLSQRTDKLKLALRQVKRLSGMLPICASCKKIRDDRGYWNQIEAYIADHSEAEFSHGICPQCARKLYPELYQKKTAAIDNKHGDER